MRIVTLVLLFFIQINLIARAQNYKITNGTISFIAPKHTSLQGKNESVKAEIDAVKNSLHFEAGIVDFLLANEGMQAKYQSKVMESDKYPKAVFEGLISDRTPVNYNKSGEYKVNAEGKLTIHGVEKPVSVTGTINVTEKEIKLHSVFTILLADYINFNPGVGNDLEINVDCIFEKK